MRAGSGSVEVIRAGLSCSSCDRQDQGIDNTLNQQNSFWSSTGTEPAVDEFLTYNLTFPVCCLTHIDLMAYRAMFQWGEPVYPPGQVSFCIGTSTGQLWPVPGLFNVVATNAWQRFSVPATAPVGHMLQVCLHGKRQAQWEDKRFYIAIRQVKAFGMSVSPASLHHFHSLMRSSPQLALPQASGVPFTTLHNVSSLGRGLVAHDQQTNTRRPSGLLFSGTALSSVSRWL